MKKILLSILLFINSIFGFGITGKVTKIPDGDTFYLKNGNKTYKVRMYGIDAPELKQSYGKESKRYLEKLILYKNVNLKIMSKDKYGRVVGKVFFHNKDINLMMIKSGNAWFYDYYAKNERKYEEAFKYARKNKLGLWKHKNPENPRDYRLKHRREK